MTMYVPTHDDQATMAAHWTYMTTLDPVLSAPRSRIIAVALLQHARAHGYEDIFLAEWRGKRAEWLANVTIRQRHWQKNTRRPSKARHHDSIAIREKYVRCGF